MGIRMMIQANHADNNGSGFGNPNHNMDQDNLDILSGYAKDLHLLHNTVSAKPNLDQQT
ncbi:MAG: hypothetical protein HQL68_12170 [Magnetococcales bacterium]|nr:hypothetical protein [Magnetococcales bacterium]